LAEQYIHSDTELTPIESPDEKEIKLTDEELMLGTELFNLPKIKSFGLFSVTKPKNHHPKDAKESLNVRLSETQSSSFISMHNTKN